MLGFVLCNKQSYEYGWCSASPYSVLAPTTLLCNYSISFGIPLSALEASNMSYCYIGNTQLTAFIKAVQME